MCNQSPVRWFSFKFRFSCEAEVTVPRVARIDDEPLLRLRSKNNATNSPTPQTCLSAESYQGGTLNNLSMLLSTTRGPV